MPRVLSFSAVPIRRKTPDVEERVVLARLIDDLQIITTDRPLALSAIAEIARRLAAPGRRRLRQQLKATLLPRRQKRSAT